MMKFVTITVVLMTFQPQSPVLGLLAHDRAEQAAAVQIIAESCDTCDEELLELWISTDRFDVRAHIVDVMIARGTEGLPDLLRMSRVRFQDSEGGIRHLLHSAFAELGPASIEALVRDIEENGGGLVHTLASMLKILDLDPSPIMDELVRSTTPEVRRDAMWHLTPLLPIPERSRLQLQLARDNDEAVRHAAVGYQGFPVWPADLRERDAQDFSIFLAGLVALLDSQDDVVARETIAGLVANDAANVDLAVTLEQFWRDDSRAFWTRTEAMQAFLAVASDPAQAVDAIISATEHFPKEACIALASVDPGLIDEAGIGVIVRALPHARGREEAFAADLIAPVSSFHLRQRIGLRAMPQLITALRDEDDALSGLAAEVIRALGPDANAAIPALIQQLERRGTNWQGKNYADALLVIAPEDPVVVRALTRMISAVDAGDKAHRYVAGNTLRELLRIAPEQEWVRGLAQPAMTSPEHPLHSFTMRSPPEEFADIIEADSKRLIAELLDTTARDEAWAFAEGNGPDVNDPSAIIRERDRRIRAGRALQQIEDPADTIINALIAALQSPVLGVSPSSSDNHPRDDRRESTRKMVLRQEYSVAVPTARVLANILDRHPQYFSTALDSLEEHPRALALVLSSHIWDAGSPNSRPLLVPADLDAGRRDIATAALRSVASERTPFNDRQSHILAALGRYGATDARVTHMLIQTVLYGSDEAGPRAAMAAIGHARPVTPEVLELIREHLNDPRSFMSGAAFSAAGHAGDRALPLVDCIITIGHSRINYSTGTNAAGALKQIAPEDPRVVEFIEAHRISTMH